MHSLTQDDGTGMDWVVIKIGISTVSGKRQTNGGVSVLCASDRCSFSALLRTDASLCSATAAAKAACEHSGMRFFEDEDEMKNVEDAMIGMLQRCFCMFGEIYVKLLLGACACTVPAMPLLEVDLSPELKSG